MKGHASGMPKKGMVGQSSKQSPESAGPSKNRLPNGVKGKSRKGSSIRFPSDIKQ